jgi:hypothetical protein
MWQRVKLAAFACCLLPVLTMAVAIAMPKSARKPAGEITRADLRAMRRPPTDAEKWRAMIPMVLAELGAIVLVVDAFMREYDNPKALPIGIAMAGLISIGLLSIVYYAIWGWLPTKREHALAERFCNSCAAESHDWPAPGTFTLNGVFGTRLIGRAAPCETCGSTVKTLWFVFLLPLIPFGSYRVLPVGSTSFVRAEYLSRRLPSVRWSQVLPLLALAAAVVGLIVVLARSG